MPEVQFEVVQNKGQPGGYAGLDTSGLVNPAILGTVAHVANVKSFGAKGDGVTDDSQAIADAIASCMANARDRVNLAGTGIFRCTGLPTLYFPPGVYVNTRTHNLRFLSGFRVVGAGKQVSVIRHQTANACFYINRSKELIFSHLTLESFDPLATTAIKGLVQNSCAFHLKERLEDNLDGSFSDYARNYTADDATDTFTSAGHGIAAGGTVVFAASTSLPAGVTAGTVYFARDVTADAFKITDTAGGVALAVGTGSGTARGTRITGSAQANAAGSTLRITFEHVEVNRFHRAYRLDGSQQLDDVKWYSPRHADNFIDFAFTNGQAVNQQLYGGEVLHGYGATIAQYEERIASWGVTGLDWRDGAIWEVLAGGQIGVFGMSMIPTKAVVVMREMNPDTANPHSVNFVGTNIAALPISFHNCRWEMRRDDATPIGVSGVSVHRCTLFRPVQVAPDSAYRSRMKLGFYNCNAIFNNSGEFSSGGVMNVFHLRNWVGFYMANCTFENVAAARIRHCVNVGTETASGFYFTVCTTNINEDVANVTGYSPSSVVKHRIHKEATEWAAPNTQAL